MNRESRGRPRLISLLISFAIHATILLSGAAVLVHQAEYSSQAPQVTDVDLEATPNVEKATLAQPAARQNPDEMVQPKKKWTAKAPPPPTPQTTNTAPAGAQTGQSGTASAKPDYLRNPLPRYPESARDNHEEGVVLLSVEVSESGDALSVELKQTSGYPDLDAAAVNAVKAWKFKPANVAGIPVKSQAEVPVRFRLEHH